MGGVQDGQPHDTKTCRIFISKLSTISDLSNPIMIPGSPEASSQAIVNVNSLDLPNFATYCYLMSGFLRTVLTLGQNVFACLLAIAGREAFTVLEKPGGFCQGGLGKTA